MYICGLFKKIISSISNAVVVHKYNINFKKDYKLNGMCYFRTYGSGVIKSGENLKINSGYRYNPIGGQERMILIARDHGRIIIGNNVGMSNSAIVAMESITIEDDVMIGGSCKIYDTDFHSIDYEHRMETPDTHIKTSPVHIKKGAFIGAHSIVLKGVTIGEKSVIGAGSVVTKDVPDGEIWAGNPAHFIKKIILEVHR